MAEIYNDSKTFVDKPLINPVDQVLFNFDVFMQVHDNFPQGWAKKLSPGLVNLFWLLLTTSASPCLRSSRYLGTT